jgi:hypothetical protein
VSPDFRDLLSEFNAAGVEYLVVGAYAMAAHGRVRATGDLDVWVRPSPENAKRVIAALRNFGAPLQDLTEQDLNRPDVVFQIGNEPMRVDILTSIDAVDFQAAWKTRFTTRLGDQPVGVLSAADLIKNKRSVARPQDLADVDWLEKAGKG